MNKKNFTSTKYHEIIGSWYGQNLGEMYRNVEMMFSKRTLPLIQKHSKYINIICKFKNIQEHMGFYCYHSFVLNTPTHECHAPLN